MGISPGDHVALSCPNVPWFPIAYFGILKAAAAVVPLNVLLKPREIAYHLKDSNAVACIAFEGTTELPIARMARAACDESACSKLVIITGDPAADAPVSSASTLGQVMDGQPAVSNHGAGAPATPRSFSTHRARRDIPRGRNSPTRTCS